jgi:hypothetical protein
MLASAKKKTHALKHLCFGVCGRDLDEWMGVVDLSISGLLSIVADASISPLGDGSLHPFGDPISNQFRTGDIQQPKIRQSLAEYPTMNWS